MMADRNKRLGRAYRRREVYTPRTHKADRRTFDAMRTACTALGFEIGDLEVLTAEQFAELYDAFAEWLAILQRVHKQ